MTAILLDTESTIRLIGFIAAVGSVVSACEYIVGPQRFSDNGILSWDVSKFHGKWSISGYSAAIANYFLSFQRFRYILLARLISALAVALMVLLGKPLSPIPLLVLVISTICIDLRSPFGLDGAYHMSLIIFVSLFLGSLFPVDSVVREACVWFIALQAGLSYLVAGVSKIPSPVWRNGTGLVGIFSTSIYGNQFIFKLLSRHPTLAAVGSWGIIVFECSFILAFFLDVRYTLVVLGMGVFFHILNAVFMGLNGFLFAFVATYPAVLYVALTIGN